MNKQLYLAVLMALPLLVQAEHNETIHLEEVEIKAGRNDLSDYAVPSSSAATRFESDNLEVPQSTQVINAEQIKDMGVVDVRDVLKQVPSAFAGHTRLAPFTSFSWKIRGLDAAVTRNGFRQLFFEDVDQSAFSNIDRVEIIKGPGGAVYGKEGLGGAIHMVTKRPEKTFSGSASVSLGQFDTKVGEFDVTGGLGDTGLALRLNGELERSGSFVDFQDVDRDNLALSAAWDQGGAVRAFFMAEYQRRETLPNPGLPIKGTVQSNGVGKVKRSTYLGEPNVDFLTTWSPLIQTWLDIDLSENWTLSPRYQHFEFNVNQQQIRVRAPVANSALVNRNGRFDFKERDETDTGQLELKGKFDVASTQHQMLIGYEINRHDYKGDWFNYASVPQIDTLNPTYLSAAPPRAATKSTFSGAIDTDELYVQDLIGLGDKFDVLLGARHSNVRIKNEGVDVAQKDKSTTFQLGTAYRFMPEWSMFAGLSTGLSVDNIGGSVKADGKAFVPERSRQREIGIKHESGNLRGSIALFQIEFKNATTTDPNDPDFSVQTGEQRSRGIEFEGAWQATSDWYVSGGLAYLDAEITKSNDGDVGNRLGNIPHVQTNLWTKYKVSPVIDVGFGANYVGKRYGTISNTYELSSYTTADASIAWSIDPRLKAEFFINNLFDKRYYTGNNNFAVYPGEPRTAYARMTVDF